MVEKIRWDPRKAQANLLKHGVSFPSAEIALRDPLLVAFADVDHSDEEDRWCAVGECARHRVLFIIYAIRHDTAWLISARQATPAERRRYVRGDRIRQPIMTDTTPSTTQAAPAHMPRWIERINLDSDVALVFVRSEDVDAALRRLIEEGRAPEPAPVREDIRPAALEYEMQPEYDLTNARPVARPEFPRMAEYRVSVDEDLLRWFPDEKAINAALRSVIAEKRNA